MKLHFAGSEPKNFREIIKEAGANGILQSFWQLKRGAEPPANKEFPGYLLDSGGFSARIRGVQIDVAKYAEYINHYGVKLAFNLDTNDMQETADNQKYLEEHCPDCYIIPIYHLSDYREDREMLDRFIDEGYTYIGIGGVAGEGSPRSMQETLYNYVFARTRNKVKVHGLGITGKPMLEKYPWYSVDSTSWLSFAQWGNSRKNSRKMSQVKAKTRHYMENNREELEYWIELEKYITKLWEKRGIKWDNKIEQKGRIVVYNE